MFSKSNQHFTGWQISIGKPRAGRIFAETLDRRGGKPLAESRMAREFALRDAARFAGHHHTTH